MPSAKGDRTRVGGCLGRSCMGTRIPQLGYRTKVDLRAKFPISYRYALRKTISMIFVLVIVALLYRLVSLNANLLGERFQLANMTGWGALLVASIVAAVKYIHAELYRRTFYYGLEGFRLVVSRGILVPQVGSLPLLPVSEIYIHRDFGDVLCHVCCVDLYTPMDDTRRFARIEGLSPRMAKELQTFLGQLLNVQIFLPPEAKVEFDYLKGPAPAAQPSGRVNADERRRSNG